MGCRSANTGWCVALQSHAGRCSWGCLGMRAPGVQSGEWKPLLGLLPVPGGLGTIPTVQPRSAIFLAGDRGAHLSDPLSHSLSQARVVFFVTGPQEGQGRKKLPEPHLFVDAVLKSEHLNTLLTLEYLTQYLIAPPRAGSQTSQALQSQMRDAC